MSDYVIAGPVDEGETLYWSNVDGWVDRPTATLFTPAERATLRLPDCDPPARWELADAAMGAPWTPAPPTAPRRVTDTEALDCIQRMLDCPEWGSAPGFLEWLAELIVDTGRALRTPQEFEQQYPGSRATWEDWPR